MREDYLPFLDDWNNYSEAILSLRTYEPSEIELLKAKVEKWLYKYRWQSSDCLNDQPCNV